MVSDRQGSAGYGGTSKSGASKGGTSKGGGNGPGASAKGSPRTQHIGSTESYESKRSMPRAMDYVPSVANKAVTGRFFASEPKFQQMRDIKEAYRGYKPSPPHAGMTGHKGFGSAMDGNSRGRR